MESFDEDLVMGMVLYGASVGRSRDGTLHTWA